MYSMLSRILCCAALLGLGSINVFGQAVYGSIVGTVTDATGAAVPRAKVTITDTGKGITYTTTTNESGNYSQTHLIVGVYQVRVEMPGSNTFVQQNVNVEVDATTQVNAHLTLGSLGETVNVNAEAPAQTKSGTNAPPGNELWYRRDQSAAARDPFAQAQPIPGTNGRFIPPTLWNQFGGSMGGPIQKDKAFIFGDYQGSRQKNGGSLLTRVPTAAERAGDLSDLGAAIFNPCAGSDCAAPLASRSQFANGVIPANLIAPQATALLKFIP